MAESDDRIIELSKTKVSLLVLGAALFVALGLWMYQLDPAWIESQRRFNSPPLVHGIGVVAALFFGFCGILGVRKLFDRKPGLILSAVGIVDNSNWTSVGLIPWADIDGFSVVQIQKERMLVVRLVDPERYIGAGGWMARALKWMSVKVSGSPVAITSSSLKIGFDELVRLCQSYHTKYRSIA